MKVRFVAMLMVMAALAAMPRGAMAQDYPTHTVTILCPFAAGGGTDLIARSINATRKLEPTSRPDRSLFENRPGAGTTIAAAATAKASP